MSIEDMSDRVKTALLMCAAKSEELEEMSKQLTVQKLRSQLSIEAIVKKAEEQLKLAKKNLLTDLNTHHDKGQAKIQELQLMVLKYNMELSSALVKEAANDELSNKVEELMNRTSCGNQVVFVPSTNLDNILSSDLGFFQLGSYLPNELTLSFSSTNDQDAAQDVKNGPLDTICKESDIVRNSQPDKNTVCDAQVMVNSAELGNDIPDIPEVNNEMVSLEEATQSAFEDLRYWYLYIDHTVVEAYEEIPVEELENIDECVSKEESGHIIDIKDVSTDSVPPVTTGSSNKLEAFGCPIQEDNEEVLSNTHQDVDVEDCLVGKYSVGSVCIAEWSEDGIWYNSTVKRVLEGGFYEVIFHDYGNDATVAEMKMEADVENIPVGAKLDELVRGRKAGVVVTEVVDAAGEEKGLEGIKTDSHCGIVEEGGDNYIAEEIPIKTNLIVSNHTDTVKSWTPAVGSLCCAKWSDRVWYNARVDELLPSGKEAVVTFVDYGNSDKVAVGKIVQNRDFIPKGARINTLVEEGAAKCILRDNLIVGDDCVTLWSQDDTWYNAVIVKVDKVNEMVEVEFTDYGNLDLVSMNDVYRKLSDVVLDRPNDKMTVDPNVNTMGEIEVEPKLSSDLIINENSEVINDEFSQVQGVDPPVSEEVDTHILCCLKSMVSKDLNGKVLLNATVVNIIPCTEDVTAMVMVKDVLVTVSSTENIVKMWNRDGGLLRSVGGKTLFQYPTDAIVIKNEGFLILDKIGLHTFDYNGNFLKTLVVDKLDTCRGMVVDSTGRVVIINRCFPGDQGMLTAQDQTDILYIDLKKGKVVKRVEMIDILEDRKESDCKALAVYMDKLYVVDSGLNCIYTLFHDDGEDQAEMYGSPGRGEGQFAGVAEVVVDDEGTLVISDSRNNRMQLVGSDWEFIGFVKVQPTPLSRPSCMCLDNDVRQLVVYNMGSNEIVRYALGNTS